MDWKEWEESVRNYFRSLGYRVSSRKIKSSNGIEKQVDVWGEKNEERIYCECKDWKSPVAKDKLVEAKGFADQLGASKVYVASMAGFNGPAKAAASAIGVMLLDETNILNTDYKTKFNEWKTEFHGMNEFSKFFKCFEGLVNCGIDKKLNYYFNTFSRNPRRIEELDKTMYDDINSDLEPRKPLRRVLNILDIWPEGGSQFMPYSIPSEVSSFIKSIANIRLRLKSIETDLADAELTLHINKGENNWMQEPDCIKLFLFCTQQLAENKFTYLFTYRKDYQTVWSEKYDSEYKVKIDGAKPEERKNINKMLDEELKHLFVQKLKSNLETIMDEPKKLKLYENFVGVKITALNDNLLPNYDGKESWLSNYRRKYGWFEMASVAEKLKDSRESTAIENIIKSIPA